MMKPRQLHERLIQPDRRSAVVKKLRNIQFRNEDEPNQPGKEAERNATRACASPGHDSPNRMTRSRRLDLKQVKALQDMPFAFRQRVLANRSALHRPQKR